MFKIKHTLLAEFIFRHIFLAIALLFTGMGAALLEGFGLSLVFPVLQGMSGIVNVAVPFPLNQITEIFKGLTMAQRLQIVSLLLLLSTALKQVLIYVSALLTSRLQLLATGEYKAKCAHQMMKIGMSYFNKQRASDFQMIFDSHVEHSVVAIICLVGTAIPMIFTVSLLMCVLVMLSWKMALFSLVLVLFATCLLNALSQKVMVASRSAVTSTSDNRKNLFDIICGMKLIRLFNRETYMIKEFVASLDRLNRDNYRVSQLSAAVGPIFETTGIGILAAILFVGSFILIKDTAAWSGILLTFVVILTRIISPIKSLNQTRIQVITKMPALFELNKFLSPEDKEFLPDGQKIFEGLKDKIELKNIHFGYIPEEVMVLKKFSLQIKKNTKVGIVGPSGSGKSTLTELLLRFYDPQLGNILVDGIDIKELNLNSWRKHIGVVSQDTFLFNETVRTNISFAKEKATWPEIERAAKRAHAHEFIQDLPEGYDTRIGDRGVMLSGGQKQRLAIARAILAEPEILIFDEATSALDTESEKIVQEALENVGKGKTVITIAHRLSTVVNSDVIFVIMDGMLVEHGTHDHLLLSEGFYRKLVGLQNLKA